MYSKMALPGRHPGGPRRAVGAVDQLPLEGGEEALRDGVVPAVAYPAHGGDEPGHARATPTVPASASTAQTRQDDGAAPPLAARAAVLGPIADGPGRTLRQRGQYGSRACGGHEVPSRRPPASARLRPNEGWYAPPAVASSPREREQDAQAGGAPRAAPRGPSPRGSHRLFRAAGDPRLMAPPGRRNGAPALVPVLPGHSGTPTPGAGPGAPAGGDGRPAARAVALRAQSPHRPGLPAGGGGVPGLPRRPRARAHHGHPGRPAGLRRRPGGAGPGLPPARPGGRQVAADLRAPHRLPAGQRGGGGEAAPGAGRPGRAPPGPGARDAPDRPGARPPQPGAAAGALRRRAADLRGRGPAPARPAGPATTRRAPGARWRC